YIRHRALNNYPDPAPYRHPPQLEKTPPGVSPRRPLPPAQQPRRRRPRKTLELLPPAHRDRTSLQGNEKRPRDPPDPSPKRRPDRGAHLHQLSGLLPLDHPQATPQSPRPRPHPR